MGRGPHRYMYNQVMHHSSQLTRQTPAFQLLFQTYSRKKKQTLSVQFRQPKSGSNKSGRGEGKKNNSVLTICGNIVKNVHEERPRLSEVWASSVPLPVKFHQSIQPYKLFVFVVFLIPIFPPLGLFTELEVGGREGMDGGSCLVCYQWVPEWACWRVFCPKGNKTTLHNFLTPPTHIQTGTGCV